MDALLPPLCLLLGIALPAALAYIVIRRGWRQMAAPVAYRQVARELGFEVDTRGASVNGYLRDDGRRLYIGEVMVGHGRDRRFEHRGLLTFAHPLGLGLGIRRRAGRRWFRRARGHEIKTGDAEFDKLFLVTGDDDDAVKALLVPELRSHLTRFAGRHPDMLVSDHGVRILLKRPETTAEAVYAIVAELRAMVDALTEARANLAPPARLDELVGLLGDLAHTRGLSLDPAWPRLSGELDGHAVDIVVRREEDGHRARVTTWFSEPRDLGLRLHRQVEPDGYWSVGQDIQVGDAAFDGAFVIKGYSPNAVRRLLTEDARRRLLALADTGDVTVDDHQLRVTKLPLDAATLGDAIDRTVAAVRSLEG